MAYLAVLIGSILVVLIGLVSIIESNQLRADSTEHQRESLSFLRTVLTALFGVVVGEGLTSIGNFWWGITPLYALLAIVAMLLTSQLLARVVGQTNFAVALVRACKPILKSWGLLFTPLAVPKTESLEEFEQELHESVEEFGETMAREIMIPRIDMATVTSDTKLAAAISEFLEGGYSRLPVTNKSIDDILGILYLKDVVRLIHEKPAKAEKLAAKDLARPAIFVPDSIPVDDLLRQLKVAATHIAIVVDEYGGVAGLATMEDVIEELVGEISDEYDRDVADLSELGDGTWRVNARFSLFDLGETFGLELEDEDVDSVGGIVAKQLGRLPKRGDIVEFAGLRFTAERIEGRRKRLVTVLVEPLAELTEAQEAFSKEPK
jgi:CBS domain containing-hemolysin-like protein